MAVKVLGIRGSPRRGGNSEMLLDSALAGAASRGAEIEKLSITDYRIAPCSNCDECRKTGQCTIINDDMEIFYRKFATLDRLILATPIFFVSVPSLLKAMIDRCQSLWVAKYVLDRPIAEKSENRKGLFIAVGHRDKPREFEPAIAVAKVFFAILNVGYVGSLTYGGIEGKGEIVSHPTALKEAFEAGAKLVDG